MRGCVSVIGLLVGVFCGVSYGGWEADKRLTIYRSYSDYGSLNNAWTIAVRDTMVHIVWEHRYGSSSVGELYYVRSANSGSTFDPHRQLTTEDSHYPSVAVCDSVIHVVWFDRRDGNREIYYKRSVDDGMNWGPDERLSNDPAISWYPSVAVCDSVVHVVWEDYRDGNEEIYYKRSVDNGETWEIDERLSNGPANSCQPSVAVCDSIVHVVWEDYRDGNDEIYYKRSVDSGENWEADHRLTNDPSFSLRPSVAVRDSIVHVVWHDRRDGNYEIYYNRSIDNGETWGIDERLTNDLAGSWGPSIAVCDSAVHVVWIDARDGGNREIYYKRSVDNGFLWYSDERLTNDPAYSGYPSVACWNCDHDYDVHVAWTDYRDNNEEIYYKRHKCEPSGVKESQELKVKSLELKVKNVVLGEVRFSIYSPHSSLVELKVFDVSGKLLDSREFAFSEGNHGFSWHNTRSGLYFFRFGIDGAEISKKVVVF